MYKDNKIMADISIPPYNCGQLCHVYSLSKSFTSTAIGLLYDEGKIDITDNAADILGVKVEKGSYADKLEIRHLLSMSAGHSECSISSIANSSDGVKEFFRKEFVYPPGTHFTYDTGASWLLSAIVTAVTGMTLFDYLNEKLFYPLNIFECKWQCSGGNISEGGLGLFISTDSLAKVALMYANRGVYNGKRILSERWISMASSKQTDTSSNGSANWSVGYGYQLWMNKLGGYRGDGAFGQYMIVIPERNIAFVALTESDNMGKQIDDIFEYIFDYEKDDNEEEPNIKDFINGIYKPSYSETGLEINKLYTLGKNLQGFTSCRVNNEGKTLLLTLSNGKDLQTISIGNGEWLENELTAPAFMPVLINAVPRLRMDTSRFFASYKLLEKNRISIDIRFVNCPHHVTAEAIFSERPEIKLTRFKPELHCFSAVKILE